MKTISHPPFNAQSLVSLSGGINANSCQLMMILTSFAMADTNNVKYHCRAYIFTESQGKKQVQIYISQFTKLIARWPTLLYSPTYLGAATRGWLRDSRNGWASLPCAAVRFSSVTICVCWRWILKSSAPPNSPDRCWESPACVPVLCTDSQWV